MKYMGSKRWQLENGLGTQLRKVARPDDRFVDLFAGSGAVSWFAAETLGLPVTAVDLQQYAVTTTAAVVERDRPVRVERLVEAWLKPASAVIERDGEVAYSRQELARPLSATKVTRLRRAASRSPHVFTRSYGGFYFSIEQARAIDELRSTIPKRRPDATVCLAALIMAASRCSASPGHTAQPFRPTKQALPHIESIWKRCLLEEVRESLKRLAARHAVKRGAAQQGDANDVATKLRGGELVFVDPPYSAAQYSRFYHVLEAIAIGGYESVEGAGRSPSLEQRASSEFSRVTSARAALTELLGTLAEHSCRVVATFPQYTASNGLSGEEITTIARELFAVDVYSTSNRFSTLGGNGDGRAARQQVQELVITMFPKKVRSR